MIKKIIVSICLLFAIGAMAQQGSASPYSFYGIGDVKFKGTAEAAAMGGIGVFPDSIHLNLQNPASYTSLKLTTLAFGGTYSNSNLRTNTQSEKARRTTLDYIALGIPMGKFGATIGLMPTSYVGYKNQSMVQNTEIRRSFGKGGVNKAFLGLAYKLTSKLSIGADLGYNFGQIETKDILFLNNIQYGSREINTSNLSGLTVNTGLMYNSKIKKKYDFYGSLVYSPHANLNLTNYRKTALIVYSQDIEQETIVPGSEIEDSNNNDKSIKLPSKLAIGTGFGQDRKWLIGAEITWLQTSSLSNRFNDISKGKFENARRYVIGGYFVPKYNSFNSYFERITYRGGFRYENTGLVINNKSVNDMAVSAGFGLPVGGRLSNVNFGIEVGKKGTKANDLIEDKYINFTLSFSLSDKWFVKSKYN
jgi:long-subunit fatty acid transport protein